MDTRKKESLMESMNKILNRYTNNFKDKIKKVQYHRYKDYQRI